MRKLNVFTESIRYLDVHFDLPDDSSQELKDAYASLRTPPLLNSALAALKIHPQISANANIAVKSATRALEHKSISATDKGEAVPQRFLKLCLIKVTTPGKALYRRALAYVALKREDEAEADLTTALQVVPGDKAISDELAKVKQRKKEKRDKEKKAFKKMFA